MSIVVVEQFARVVLGVAHRATIMAHGEVVREGTPAELEERCRRHTSVVDQQAQSSQRVDRFEAAVAALSARQPTATRERLLLRLSVVLLVAGPVWIAVEYFVSHGTRSGLQQRDAIIGAIFGLALTLVGGVLFLRHSTGRLVRYGIARIAYGTDQLAKPAEHESPTGFGPVAAESLASGGGRGDHPPRSPQG